MKKQKLFEKVAALKAAQTTAAATLSDDVAVDCVAIFPAWAEGVEYAIGARVRYGEHLYRCVQAHTSQADWTPDITPALWTEVAKPGEIPVWKQPTGAQDAYSKGDKVHFPGQSDPIYESLIDANIWAPDAYPAGWKQL